MLIDLLVLVVLIITPPPLNPQRRAAQIDPLGHVFDAVAEHPVEAPCGTRYAKPLMYYRIQLASLGP